MESSVQNYENICKVLSIDSIWNKLDNYKKLQYFWLGSQSYNFVWELQKKLHII